MRGENDGAINQRLAAVREEPRDRRASSKTKFAGVPLTISTTGGTSSLFAPHFTDRGGDTANETADTVHPLRRLGSTKALPPPSKATCSLSSASSTITFSDAHRAARPLHRFDFDRRARQRPISNLSSLMEQLLPSPRIHPPRHPSPGPTLRRTRIEYPTTFPPLAAAYALSSTSTSSPLPSSFSSAYASVSSLTPPSSSIDLLPPLCLGIYPTRADSHSPTVSPSTPSTLHSLPARGRASSLPDRISSSRASSDHPPLAISDVLVRAFPFPAFSSLISLAPLHRL